METNKLHENDDFGILPHLTEKIPYFSIRLTNEQVEALRSKKPVVYETNGLKFFKVKDVDGSLTEDCMMFIMFVD